jgi:hypothetical protein
MHRITSLEEQHDQSDLETPSEPLDAIKQARGALQEVLRRLMNDGIDVEIQARHVPRVTSALMQAIRTGDHVNAGRQTPLIDEIREVVGKIEAEGRPDHTIFMGEETS